MRNNFKILILCLFLSACSAGKKNVSVAKTHIDSTASEAKKDLRVIITDSANKKTNLSSYSKETELSYVPYEIDSVNLSSLFSPPSEGLEEAGVGGGSILIINSPHQGKKIVFVPNIKIKETGTKAKEENTHLQKNDAASSEVKKEVSLRKDEKVIEKKKVKVGFNWWWLLLLLPLIILHPKVRKYILNKLT